MSISLPLIKRAVIANLPTNTTATVVVIDSNGHVLNILFLLNLYLQYLNNLLKLS